MIVKTQPLYMHTYRKKSSISCMRSGERMCHFDYVDKKSQEDDDLYMINSIKFYSVYFIHVCISYTHTNIHYKSVLLCLTFLSVENA